MVLSSILPSVRRASRSSFRTPGSERWGLTSSVIALAWLAIGCSPAPKRPTTFEDEWRDAPDHVAAPSSGAEPSLTFTRQNELASLRAYPEFQSAHPVRFRWATPRVSAAFERYGERPPSPPPAGALLVQTLREAPGSSPVELWVMEKRETGFFPEGGDFLYAVLREDGTVKTAGRLQLCARCHAEAPADFLFQRVTTER